MSEGEPTPPVKYARLKACVTFFDSTIGKVIFRLTALMLLIFIGGVWVYLLNSYILPWGNNQWLPRAETEGEVVKIGDVRYWRKDDKTITADVYATKATIEQIVKQASEQMQNSYVPKERYELRHDALKGDVGRLSNDISDLRRESTLNQARIVELLLKLNK